MIQQDIFHTLDNKHCPHCHKMLPHDWYGEPKKAYGYELNKDLIEIAMTIWEWCYNNKRKSFLSKEVSTDHKFLTQFQKLQYFDIIRRKRKSMYWSFTLIGYTFLKGTRALPRKVWVRKSEVIMADDVQYVTVSDLIPNWKITSQDWIQDYMLLPYEVSLFPQRA